MPDDNSPISASEASRLFADWKSAPAIVLAVSGGPDSIALMWLAARWRRALARGPRLIVATVDHGLRPEAAAEARQVKRLARALDLPHRTLHWTGTKPKTGLPAAARSARYRLLAQLARKSGATHVFTAHTRDDQAETLLMRLLRGSGIAGLAAMAGVSEREGILLVRPFLNVSKAQLIATVNKAKLGFADDPTNRDLNFTRPRIRRLMPVLAAEGGDSRNLARLASRLARANAAVELMVDGAERYLALSDRQGGRQASRPGLAAKDFDAREFEAREFDAKEFDAKEFSAGNLNVGNFATGNFDAGNFDAGNFDAGNFDAMAFSAMPEEIRVRLLMRAIDRCGREGPAELGKVEALLAALDQTVAENGAGRRTRLKQTLAGALVSLVDDRIRVEPAPPRRRPHG